MLDIQLYWYGNNCAYYTYNSTEFKFIGSYLVNVRAATAQGLGSQSELTIYPEGCQ